MRAGYTGSVKDACAIWTGDQHVDWSVDDGLPSVIPASLSLGMSGQTKVHSDAGGYTTIMHMTRSKELLMRWEEMNAFSPLFRTHEGNQPSRSVQFDGDEELLEQLAKMSKIHAALKPYLKKIEKEADEGIPMMRPLFYHYEEEWAYEEKGEYLLGRDLLVAPVLKEGDRKRTVRLPEDSWIHFFTKKEYGKGDHEVEAPIGMPPVFIRKGSELETYIRSLQEEF
jgi:alpha-glucosidase